MKIVKYKSLFVFSNKDSLYFHENFGDGINIISGRNTSGKSTLIQSLLFSFGINDVRKGLSEVLESKPIFRLDFSVTIKGEDYAYTIIRDGEHLYVEEPDGKILSFNGVSSNHNREHVKLKSYIDDLLGFSLKLEQKNEFKSAPIESAFLPYYISQSVGWVYLRESFSNFSYYKNFTQDFLDYYLGIADGIDRENLIALELQKKELKTEIKSLEKHISQPEFKISQLLDERFGEQAKEYIEDYIKSKEKENQEAIKYTEGSEKLSIIEQHKKIVSQTIRKIKTQKPDNIDNCPACKQILPHSLESLYEHYQNKHDSEELKDYLDGLIKTTVSKLTTVQATQEKLRKSNKEQFEILERLNIEGTTLKSWLDGKATVQLQTKLEGDINALEEDLVDVENKIGKLIGNNNLENTLEKQRKNKAKIFKSKFRESLQFLGVKPLTEERYLDIYEINSFPYQGVELHKTMLAYHFSFNYLISKTPSIHRLPFLLDAILKEDIDQTNIDILFNFINSEAPKDTQLFMSISDFAQSTNEGDKSRKSVEQIIEDHFNNANNIVIGEGIKERAFLSQTLDKKNDLYQDTFRIIEMN